MFQAELIFITLQVSLGIQKEENTHKLGILYSFNLITMTSSTGGSDLFQNYEQDFQTVTDGVRQKIDQQIPSQTGGT